jgi:homeobox protein cut-like
MICIRIRSLEGQITELQTEATRLLSTLETQKQIISQTKEEKVQQETEFTKRIKKLEDEISTLRTKTAQYADYDEIKRELEIMKVSILNWIGIVN